MKHGERQIQNRELQRDTMHFSVAQLEIIEDAINFFETSDGNIEIRSFEDMRRLRNVEILVSVANVMSYLERPDIGIDWNSVEIPNSVDDYESEKKISHVGELIRSHAKIYSALQEGDTEGYKEVFAMMLDGAKRRLQFIKKSLEIKKQFGFDDQELPQQLRRTLREAALNMSESEIPQHLAEYPDEVQRLLCQPADIEFNVGCSVACSFCAFSAPSLKKAAEKSGAKMSFTSKEATWLATHCKNPEVFLYKRSDPLDYVAPDNADFNISHVVLLREAVTGTSPYTSTGYPTGSADRVQDMGTRINRFSISNVNSRRLVEDGIFRRTAGGSFLPASEDIADGIFFGGNFHFYLDSASSLSRMGHPKYVTDKIIECYIAPDRGKGDVYFFLGDSRHPILSGYERKVAIRKGDSRLSDPKLTGTIDCRKGVIISPNEILNSVPTNASDFYPNGFASAVLSPDIISRGTETIKSIDERLKSGQLIQVDEILACGIVECRSFRTHARVIRTCFYINIYTSSKNPPFEKWYCEYSVADGEILSLRKDVKE